MWCDCDRQWLWPAYSPVVKTNIAIAIPPNFFHCDTASAVTRANTVLSGTNHRHGNCTKESFGSKYQRGKLKGSIRKTDVMVIANSRYDSSREPFRGQVNVSPKLTIKISIPPKMDIAVFSGNDAHGLAEKRKLFSGLSPGADSRRICTHCCS